MASLNDGLSNVGEHHLAKFFAHCAKISSTMDLEKIEHIVEELQDVRKRQGRLFILGVGGSAGNASHAVNDFRKLCGIDACAPTDNVSEITARTNDDGFETIFEQFLMVSNANDRDAIFVLSVGGGNEAKNVSVNLINAAKTAQSRGLKILGIVGRDDGYIARNGDVVVVVPRVDDALLTPLSESFQTVVWHALVSHPKLQIAKTKW